MLRRLPQLQPCSPSFRPQLFLSTRCFMSSAAPSGASPQKHTRSSSAASQSPDRKKAKSVVSNRTVVSTPDAPAAIGPYSQGISCGGTLYVSGQLGLDPKTGNFGSQDVEGQTEQALKNIGAILEAGGSSFKHTTILLRDMNDFAKVNGVYGKYFPTEPPARATYAVAGLPKTKIPLADACLADGLVEIEAVASVPEQS